MKDMARKNLHLPDEVVRLIGDVLHSARFRSETQAVIAMLEGASDRLKDAAGYVYLMRGEKGLKIGTSIQPHARSKALGADLLHCIPGDRLSELAVHMIWGRYRVSGEWFENKREIVDWFSNHEMAVDPGTIQDKGPVAHFTRLQVPQAMRLEIERWRTENRDEETGKIPSFSEAVRALIERGLAK